VQAPARRRALGRRDRQRHEGEPARRVAASQGAEGRRPRRRSRRGHAPPLRRQHARARRAAHLARQLLGRGARRLPDCRRGRSRQGEETTMKEQTTAPVDPNSVKKVMKVQAPPALAWRVFTEKMGTWWPLAHYKIGKTNAVDAVIDPRAGGRWYERGD